MVTAFPKFILDAAEACYAECEQSDSYDIVQCISKSLMKEMEKAFCVGWERGNSIWGGHDPEVEFSEWIEEGGKP